MEFLNLSLIMIAGWLLLRKPEKRKLADRLLVTAILIMAALFLMVVQKSILPPLNY